MTIKSSRTAAEDAVAHHYARGGLIDVIESALAQMGKTRDTVTIDDLSAVDEFHIGGRKATEELMAQLRITAADHVLDVGSGLGGPARFLAARYKCRVSGVDLTRDYVETGSRICQWMGLDDRITLHRSTALAMPFQESTFSKAYMLHVGMNVEDKENLCLEIARVLQPGALFSVYDVMRTAEGELLFPVPWATTSDSSTVSAPERYKRALQRAGFEILSERNRKDFALAYFADLRARSLPAGVAGPLGLHTLMGERRQDQIRNMMTCISKGIIAPCELIARKT
ncbi:methyltransferase domain-containing protein [Bradyrhizobium xenonodulans]|uniref:Methyltransferase domain-containing protein n=1 Tax=Bradyrhizobium xenonodulans TaxID=2736875 RepID=A0ABY7MFW7_9BRAD|nr:class I SAM-dependent methyltransferase [Bradyrhizobium xenonodulans]WBL77272.1 methyltransferase domain-containing protein [Bradyrhizobium xenonodulans]